MASCARPSRRVELQRRHRSHEDQQVETKVTTETRQCASVISWGYPGTNRREGRGDGDRKNASVTLLSYSITSIQLVYDLADLACYSQEMFS